MAKHKFTEGDIIAKKLACKYDPPTLAFEYHVKNLNSDLLLQINLEECIKRYDDPMEICQWVFHNYADVINSSTISEKQVLNLIQRILLMRRMDQSKRKTSNNSGNDQELFEPDASRKEEEKEFFKSNQNFYKQGDDSNNEHDGLKKEENITKPSNAPIITKSNKNSALEERNQSYSDDFIKQELKDSNKINRYIINKDDLEQKEAGHENDNEIKMNNLSEYFNKKKSVESDNFNYMDEISVESLNSEEHDDKF